MGGGGGREFKSVVGVGGGGGSSPCAEKSVNKFITSYVELRATNFRRNSWVYQNYNFDLIFRQINITTVRGPLVINGPVAFEE